ncbi:MAG: TIGR02588 family protein [Phormidesmis priestleyi Ana]|uniref:TIGR02588 family protein n=1 Tax=Phormidesmis priestleyi Ana TaxID=1666911 RepID=A0A0P8C744_9CYAN|nr:MAG: TIGR02588 family protein [Phormidesmis priestleyi Ana]
MSESKFSEQSSENFPARSFVKSSAKSSAKSFEKKNGSDDSVSAKSPAERVSFWLSSALVVSIIATVIYLWVRDRNQQPPFLEVTSSVERRGSEYYVPFKVTNSSGQTVASVQVVAELRINGVVVEEGEQQIDFLSSQEEKEGAFIFTQPVPAGDLIVRPASYQLP